MRRDKHAVAPAVSTVILTAAVVVMILVAATYASTFLDKRLAENEYSANKQFMLTTGLQLDDIAWTIGRTQTIRYSSRYGNMMVKEDVLRYRVFVDGAELFNVVTGIIMFNMPVSSYSVGNGYFERVTPTHSGSFIQLGSSAPVCHVFCAEKLPMSDGGYTRIVMAPTIRTMTAEISRESSNTTYFKFYLPILEFPSGQRYLSQSVTLTGENVTKFSTVGDNQVAISVEFLDSDFDNIFFKFESVNEVISPLPPDSVIEFYVGTVSVKIGEV
ncbi:MAG: hypothetical protein QXJ76_00850 [Candidatus Bathyarchaeia archaeon]